MNRWIYSTQFTNFGKNFAKNYKNSKNTELVLVSEKLPFFFVKRHLSIILNLFYLHITIHKICLHKSGLLRNGSHTMVRLKFEPGTHTYIYVVNTHFPEILK